MNLIKTEVLNSIFTYVGNRCLKLRKPHSPQNKIRSFFSSPCCIYIVRKLFFFFFIYLLWHLICLMLVLWKLKLPGVISRDFFLLHIHGQEAIFHLSALASHLPNASTLKLLGVIRRAFFLLHIHWKQSWFFTASSGNITIISSATQ